MPFFEPDLSEIISPPLNIRPRSATSTTPSTRASTSGLESRRTSLGARRRATRRPSARTCSCGCSVCVCVCGCVCVCVCVCSFTCTRAFEMQLHTSAHTSTSTHPPPHTHTHAHARSRAHAPPRRRRLWERGNCSEQAMEQLYSEAAGKFLADRYVSGTCPKCGYEVRRRRRRRRFSGCTPEAGAGGGGCRLPTRPRAKGNTQTWIICM